MKFIDTISQTYTITAALPYANGPMHLGHIAGVYLPADIYARYQRKRGQDVAFICGSDEGGAAITLRAYQEGTTPQTLVDKYHKLNKQALQDFGISFDIFHRTSEKLHHGTAQDFFMTLHKKKCLITREESHYYDPEANFFLADRYIQGICPRCGMAGAYGDQCETCNATLNPQELINPTSKLSGVPPILKKTKHWYFPLDLYQKWLSKWILEEHKDWRTNVYGQCKSWLQEGLRPRSITRDLEWGVSVPLVEAPSKVLYVWFEAPIGYISATKAWAQAKGKDWQKYWKDPKTTLIHFVGKDNIVFHCIIFPAMLKAHGDYILPKHIPASEFMNLEDKKISTSRGHAIWLHDYLALYPGQQDALRYTLCMLAPETRDTNFTWQDLITHNEQALVAIVGNLVNRTLTLLHKHFEGYIPEPQVVLPADQALLANLRDLYHYIDDNLRGFRFKKAIKGWVDIARSGNKYLADTQPWKVTKEDFSRLKTILYITLQLIAHLAHLAEPFLPSTSQKLHAMLRMNTYPWQQAEKEEFLPAGHLIGTPFLLFTKMELPNLQ